MHSNKVPTATGIETGRQHRRFPAVLSSGHLTPLPYLNGTLSCLSHFKVWRREMGLCATLYLYPRQTGSHGLLVKSYSCSEWNLTGALQLSVSSRAEHRLDSDSSLRLLCLSALLSGCGREAVCSFGSSEFSVSKCLHVLCSACKAAPFR